MSILQEGLEGDFLDWVLVLATTLVIMGLNEFLFEFLL